MTNLARSFKLGIAIRTDLVDLVNPVHVTLYATNLQQRI